MMDAEKDAAVTAEAKKQELALWKEWKSSGSQRTLGKLMESVQPILVTTVRKFESVPLPPSAIKAEAMKQALGAFKTFDPKAGASLGTHVTNYMQKVNRFVYEHQNVGRIPEHRITQIGTFNAVKGELKSKFGREPSATELSDDLNWSLPEVERMERELKREMPESAALDVDFSFTATNDSQKILNYIYYELSPREKVVFEHLTGWAGKPRLTEAEISVRIGATPDRVKKIKAKIAEKIRGRMP
jgi:DNA-directed RNA polymerase sigma subunit (sigma70/sigma32)